MNTKLPFDYYLDVFSRRKWLVGGVLLFALAVAWITCLAMPKLYKSTTVIAVEQQKIPEHYVKGVVTGAPQDRLHTIQQFILSRTLLGRVIEQYHLAPPQGEGTVDSVIDSMRKKISVTTTRDTVFSISFKHGDPAIAQKVTAALASSFIDETTKVREQLVEAANEFIEAELEKAKAELEAREKAIGEFKRENMGELPQQLEANLRALDRLQIQLLSHNESLSNRNDRLAMIEKAIKEYETTGTVSQDVAGPAGSAKAITGGPIASRVRELQQQLVKLRATFKDSYPDVVHLKEEIARLQAMPDEPMAPVELAPTPTAKKTVDPYLRELHRQRDEIRLDLESLKDKVARVSKDIKEYETRVEHAPAQEQKLQMLTRDYENMQKNFQALVDKKLNARVSENLERRQKGEQFRIIDPANLPTTPDSPDQVNIMLIGLILGCGGGVGLAFALEHLQGVIRRSEDAEGLLGLPVFATIPDFKMAYEGSNNKALPNFSTPSDQDKATGRPRSAASAKEVFNDPDQKNALLPWRKSASPKTTPSNGISAADLVKLELNLVAKWRPTSLIAEQFRVAATRLVLSNASNKGTVVVVTSAVKGEGKSSIASNLAYVLSHDLGRSTVLIDCDFKRPMLHAYNGIPAKPGLAEAIYGDLPLDSCLHQSGTNPLWVLPSGRRDHRLVDLTKIPQVTSIVEELKNRYEFVILDAPPILPLADMNLLAAMADSLVLVVRSGVTPHDIVQKALKTLTLRGGAGIILTGHDVQKVPGYMQEYYLAGQGSQTV